MRLLRRPKLVAVLGLLCMVSGVVAVWTYYLLPRSHQIKEEIERTLSDLNERTDFVISSWPPRWIIVPSWQKVYVEFKHFELEDAGPSSWPYTSPSQEREIRQRLSQLTQRTGIRVSKTIIYIDSNGKELVSAH